MPEVTKQATKQNVTVKLAALLNVTINTTRPTMFLSNRHPRLRRSYGHPTFANEAQTNSVQVQEP